MVQRKQTLQQSAIFLKQNPDKAHQMTVSDNSEVSRYVTNIADSNAYWHKVKEDLKATIYNVGPPIFFFTFSLADMLWPELHDLFSPNTISEQ